MTETTVDLRTPRGIIHCTEGLVQSVPELQEALTVDKTTIQGVLRDNDVFERIKHIFMLPASYTVINVFYDWKEPKWNIVVASNDIPASDNGWELPELSPTYRRNEDGSTQLVDISATIRKRAISFEDMVKGMGYKFKVNEYEH